VDPKSNQIKPDPTADGECFVFNDPNLIQFEQALSRWRNTDEDIWLLRDALFLHLAEGSGKETRLRFRLGFLSYLPKLFLSCLCARRSPDANPPPAAEFLVFVSGLLSKEYDTLKPIITELAKTHTVLVLWISEEAVPADVIESLLPAKLWHVRHSETIAESKTALLADCASVGRLLLRVAIACRHLRGIGRAFWQHGAPLFDYLICLRLWERFLTARLAGHPFRTVAFVSDINPPGKILAKLARRHGWRSHHFMHGFPGLENTQAIATDIYSFSQIDRDYFIEHGWPPSRVHAIGHPRQVSLTRQIRSRRTLAVGEGGVRVLFAGTHAVKGGFDDRQHHQTMQTVLEVASRLQLTPAEFRVRLHPVDDPAIYPKLAERFAPHLGKDAISNRPVAEDLAWANVVLTVSSTMAMEAAYADCLLIWLSFGPFRYEIRERLAEHGYGLMATSGEELRRILEACCDPANRAQLIDKFLSAGRAMKVLNQNAAMEAAKIMVITAQAPGNQSGR
jgi:hypothetical protein